MKIIRLNIIGSLLLGFFLLGCGLGQDADVHCATVSKDGNTYFASIQSRPAKACKLFETPEESQQRLILEIEESIKVLENAGERCAAMLESRKGDLEEIKSREDLSGIDTDNPDTTQVFKVNNGIEVALNELEQFYPGPGREMLRTIELLDFTNTTAVNIISTIDLPGGDPECATAISEAYPAAGDALSLDLWAAENPALMTVSCRYGSGIPEGMGCTGLDEF